MAKLITPEMLQAMMGGSGKITSDMANQLAGVNHQPLTLDDDDDFDLSGEDLDWGSDEDAEAEQAFANMPNAPAPTPAPSPQPFATLNAFANNDDEESDDPFAGFSDDDDDLDGELKIPNSQSQNQFPPMDDVQFAPSDDDGDGDGDNDTDMKSSWQNVSDLALPLPSIFEDDDLDGLDQWIASLRKRGPRTNAVDSNGATALHFACLWDRPEMVTALLSGSPCVNIDTQTSKRAIVRTDSSWRIPAGSTALHVACQCDTPECVEILLAHNASIDLKDGDGQTAAEVAEDNDSEECLEFINNHSAVDNVRSQLSNKLQIS